MEKVYDVFKYVRDLNHRVGRKDYFITIILYNLLVYMLIGIMASSYFLVFDTNRVNLEMITNIFYFVTLLLILPLYTTQYHRILDTGVGRGAALVFPIIGFIFKISNLIMAYKLDGVPLVLFGQGTLATMFSYYGETESPCIFGGVLYPILQSIYILVNLIMILTKTNQFKKSDVHHS